MGRLWQIFQTVLGIIFRHPITGTTIIPILPNGQIVLVRRFDTGQWGLPGGIIDWGEDVSTAAHRELKEETGLTLIKIRRLVGVYSAPDRDPRIHSISILIEADVEGRFEVQDTLEVTEIKAFSLDELPLGNLSHDHEQQLTDYLQGTTVLA
ncbi:NUDIX hydrolase [Aphanothece hegewaldii CCALA 016]|uniref:NUDIX hydrolase n=1 Tax=Aphanothece hegewaldii CCALA 016 TaxID=2107694 RepID=A0A2T1M2H8_9CHRO|nr:NUDIX hydrolase [Aphanothece hegewaldii]PSF38951.1 NUDIX hydrolase [Aphanothece hegewaldii CCALA 016]